MRAYVGELLISYNMSRKRRLVGCEATAATEKFMVNSQQHKASSDSIGSPRNRERTRAELPEYEYPRHYSTFSRNTKPH